MLALTRHLDYQRSEDEEGPLGFGGLFKLDWVTVLSLWFGLAESDNPVTFLPLASLTEKVYTLEALEDALLLQGACPTYLEAFVL